VDVEVLPDFAAYVLPLGDFKSHGDIATRTGGGFLFFGFSSLQGDFRTLGDDLEFAALIVFGFRNVKSKTKKSK
jgi:hypothetical protein